MIITRVGRFKSILFFFSFEARVLFVYTNKKRSKMYGGKNDELVGKSRPRSRVLVDRPRNYGNIICWWRLGSL